MYRIESFVIAKLDIFGATSRLWGMDLIETPGTMALHPQSSFNRPTILGWPPFINPMDLIFMLEYIGLTA